MSAGTKLVTAQEFLQMHFDVPTELVRGETVSMTRPGWRHGAICANAAAEIHLWCRRTQFGFIVCNDAGVLIETDPDTLRGPDLFYVSRERFPHQAIPDDVPTDVVPNLCVEVLSPSDRWRDVQEKIGDFFRCGVEEVWVVNPERKTVEVFRPDVPPEPFRIGDTLTSRVLPDFSCTLEAVFEGT